MTNRIRGFKATRPREIPVDQKDVAFYTASITAWFTTKLEYDKAILTLSTAGLGLLFALLTTTNVLQKADDWLISAYIGAILFFLTSSVCILSILTLNGKQIELVINENPGHSALKWLDWIAVGGFILGIALTSTIAVFSAINMSKKTEVKMADEKNTKRAIAQDSFASMEKLIKGTTLNKSFQNMGNLQQGATSKQPPAQSAPKTTAPAVPNSNNGTTKSK